jgi:hypothetical protein
MMGRFKVGDAIDGNYDELSALVADFVEEVEVGRLTGDR